MATVLSVVKITKTEDDSLSHFDVNYNEGFVVVVKPEELEDVNDVAEILSVAAPKAAAIEALTPATESEELVLPE